MNIFPIQLTTSRIGNLTRSIHTLLYVMTTHTYIHTDLIAAATLALRLGLSVEASYDMISRL